MTSLERILANPRVTMRRTGHPAADGKCVVYWMQRSQRGIDNPALNVAIEVANELEQPLAVFFGLHPGYPNGNLRHYTFLMEGIAETAAQVEQRGAAFVFRPFPHHDLIRFCETVKASIVISDENPMREPARWRDVATARLHVPFYTVDADVVVPTKFFTKEEYAARTIRPKINKVLAEFLVPTANPVARIAWNIKHRPQSSAPIDQAILDSLPLDRSTQPVTTFRGGTSAGMKLLNTFLTQKLQHYNTARNLPDQAGTSSLSAYLHFGQISPVTIALAVQAAEADPEAKAAYLEELIVRREVAINFVARNPRYDQLSGCPDWAQKTLQAARHDPRPVLYQLQDFENAVTHDDLWNAAQMEMVKTGKMHGYLRMYWAKKILEWTASPEEAFDFAIHLNDKYQLDGRDPNGFTGVAWAIGGKHDRPWAPKRAVFGMIRYMSYDGCNRKFDLKAYIRKVNQL